jgi:hypothetical protein
MKLFRQTGETLVGLTDTAGGTEIGATNGDEGGTGSSASGGKVAESSGECFSTRKWGWGGAGEVYAFDHGIGFEDEIEISRKGRENCTVMTNRVADSCGGLPTQSGDPVVDPKIFGREGKFFHGMGGRARRMRMHVFALKREWTRMEGMRLWVVRKIPARATPKKVRGIRVGV